MKIISTVFLLSLIQHQDQKASSFVIQPPTNTIVKNEKLVCTASSSKTLTSNYLANTASVPSEYQKEEGEKEKEEIETTTTSKKLIQWGRDKIPILSSKRREKGNKNIKRITTMEEYKKHVVNVTDKIVVVRFFATWCRSCKAAAPAFYRMAATQSPDDVVFVEVPLLKENAFLHVGLGVPSVPFGHIYHPEVGLVEEMKISRKFIRKFEEALNSYVRGSCDLYGEDEEMLSDSDVVYVDSDTHNDDTPIGSVL